VNGATYDAGALIAAERGSREMWLYHRRLLRNGIRPSLSAAVLGQAWRGGPQPVLSRFIRGCRVAPLTGSVARTAGAALARSQTEDLIDAVVVITALARGEVVVTSDPDDVRRIAQALGRALVVHVV
jgi:hypothetical protein